MVYRFGNLDLDLDTHELRLDGEPIPLEPKPFDLLAHLISRRGTVVTKDELYDVLWPDTVVSEWALTSAVKLARRALRKGGVREAEGLGIKTVHGKGFRFVGEVLDTERSEPEVSPAESFQPASETGFVGRESELLQLVALLSSAREGQMQSALVAGDAGIGKTALVDSFIERARADGARIALGQSVEQYGSGEPYLPVLEALGRLLDGTDGEGLIGLLRRLAPNWLAHLPRAVDAAELAEIRERVAGSTQDRMLREIGELFEAATATSPIVIVLEDIHWSDPATIELFAYLSQRRSPARVLLVGTYRPSEVIDTDHPLRAAAQKLAGREHGTEMTLAPLSEEDVRAYLEGRLTGGTVSDDLIRTVHGRTEGQPLFLSDLVDYSLGEGLIRLEEGRWQASEDLRSLVPTDARRMIERQVESLPPRERRVLEAAAAAGQEFSVASVAAALEEPLGELEEICEALAWRNQFLEDDGVDEWPDGTLAGRYAFRHALYVDVLYARIASARRVRLHRAIAETKERAFGDRAGEISAELATHFERARAFPEAIAYHERAARRATSRHANQEAVAHLHASLELIPQLPEDERGTRELTLVLELLGRLRSARAEPTSRYEPLFQRGLELAEDHANDDQRTRLFISIANVRLTSGRSDEAKQMATEALAHAERSRTAVAQVQAHYVLGGAAYQPGDLDAAETHYTRVKELYDPADELEHVGVYGESDPAVGADVWLSALRFTRGFPDQAREIGTSALDRARALGHPLSLSWAHLMISLADLVRSDLVQARTNLSTALEIAREHGFEGDLALAGLSEGWCLLLSGQAVEATAVLEEARARYEALGTPAYLPMALPLLGAAAAFSGRIEDGMRHFEAAEAAASETNQPLAGATALRSRLGVVIALGLGDFDEAEAELRESLELVAHHGDRMGELATAIQIANVRIAASDLAGARDVLEPRFLWFTEGFDLPPLQEAATLLERVRSSS